MKVFIDTGAHRGVVSQKFHKKHPNYKIYAFEPNPFADTKLPLGATLIKKAVWVENLTKDFYLYEDTASEGCTLMYNKVAPTINRTNPIQVECIDFSRWILDTFSKEDKIVLKMDIEGAEYEVLNKMIDDKSIEYINKLYPEFHANKLNMDKRVHVKLIKKLAFTNTLKLRGELKA